MKYVFLILAMVLPAMAGREFSHNPQKFGHLPNTTIATNLHGASGMSASAWVRPNYFLSSADCNDVVTAFFGGTTVALNLRVGFSLLSGGYVVGGGRRQSSDANSARISTNTLTAGVWSHIAVTMAFGSHPKVYINGVESVGSTAGSSASSAGTFVSSAATVPDGIGCVPTTGPALLNTNRVFQGYMAEVGVWRRELSASDVMELANGAPPSSKLNGLIVNTPLIGQSGTEVNLVGTICTVTNSPAFANHPRIYRP